MWRGGLDMLRNLRLTAVLAAGGLLLGLLTQYAAHTAVCPSSTLLCIPAVKNDTSSAQNRVGALFFALCLLAFTSVDLNQTMITALTLLQLFLQASKATKPLTPLYAPPRPLILNHAVKNDTSGAQNRVGAIFFALCLLAFTSVTSVDLIQTESAAAGREMQRRYYHPAAYAATKLVLDGLLLRALPALLFALPFYFLMGLNPAALQVRGLQCFQFHYKLCHAFSYGPEPCGSPGGCLCRLGVHVSVVLQPVQFVTRVTCGLPEPCGTPGRPEPRLHSELCLFIWSSFLYMLRLGQCVLCQPSWCWARCYAQCLECRCAFLYLFTPVVPTAT